jgi:D-alanyl-D-alanine carboxypeptidase (penicillin-binding protein 5/6)
MPVGEALVQNGARGTVRLQTEREVHASVRPGNAGAPALTVRYRGPIEAPIAKGDQVAFLHVAIPGQTPHDVPLVAAEAVPEANALQRFVNGLFGLLS